jgi:sialate O-acetylesterase
VIFQKEAKNMRKACLVIILAFSAWNSFEQIRLPRLISDGMILQRELPVRVWGWASPGENILLDFNNRQYKTAADKAGSWEIMLAPVSAGGPYEMKFTASNKVEVKDIFFGDVWVCSGQSNMEFMMERLLPLFETQLPGTDNPLIRMFRVPQNYNFKAVQYDFPSGGWQKATPESVLKFSAVAWYFADELYKKYHVPVGLINASLGGSPAEAWISEDAVKEFPAYYAELQKFKNDSLIVRIEAQDKKRSDEWYKLLNTKDRGYSDTLNPWYKGDMRSTEWMDMEVPGFWANTPLGAVNGVVWFRKEINVPASMVDKPERLILGCIVDADYAFINGIQVGNTGYMYPSRKYAVAPGILHEGKNIIVVRIISNKGKGGFVAGKSYELVSQDERLDLKGTWQYRLGAVMDPLEGQTFVRWKPVGLFNAMIAPLVNYTIKGAVWYQGESNTSRYAEYTKLLNTLISDWRGKWDQGNFPFLFVQLPNYMEAKTQPSESEWALFRDAQMKALAVPVTGMVVTYDIGEWNDIHPLNKKDVGVRLALAAGKVAYGDQKVVFSGPIYNEYKIKGNKVSISFLNTGTGLMARGGELKCFSVAAADGKFVWAKAVIQNDSVLVWSDEIQHPVSVRYAWADNPEGANLYNKEGLPAAPFWIY